MYDVRKILWKIAFIGGVGLLIMLFPSKRSLEAILKTAVRLWRGAVLLVGLSILLGGFAIVFNRFHMVFFKGNRQFPENSLLIQMYPEQFFLVSMIGILVIITLFLHIGRGRSRISHQ